MESIQETPILKFSETTLQDVRKELNLERDDLIKMLTIFKDWITKQNHFIKTDFSDHYLETSIIYAKGSLEKAKKTLDKLCTMKTLIPNIFEKHDARNELIDTRNFVIQATMPYTKDNYRIYIIKLVSSNFDSTKFFDFLRYSVLMGEYVKQNDYALGFNCVVDCGDVNLISLVNNINIVDLRNYLSVLMEGYGFRIKGIQILSQSKAVDVLVSLLKQLVSAKIGGRIHVHKNLESLHQVIEKKYLPKDLGGEGKSMLEISDSWMDTLSTKENVAFIKEMCQAGTNEKYRLAANYNDQILGIPGSFRTLNVD